ncbi:cytochrome b [Hydrogenovibrio halophilus]|uniref:cytochrome b n=1 Tax=Hydrogenovibrio halophilus TaxID=373391 RepID=UPI0003634176|nr:cytochrome b/b6 domain-containing protein [Hydrogenovibrio halophilus]
MKNPPPLFNSSHAYGRLTIVLHWATAWLFLIVTLLGWWMEDFDWLEALMTQSHYLVGLLVLLLGGIRLTSNALQVRPADLGQDPVWQTTLKQWTQKGLLASLILIPLTGFLTVFWDDDPAEIFGWALPHGSHIEALSEFAESSHEFLVNVALFLIALHVLGALKHHWFDMDDTLNRMRGK